MPRGKRSNNTEESSEPRRRSSRIADKPATSPTKNMSELVDDSPSPKKKPRRESKKAAAPPAPAVVVDDADVVEDAKVPEVEAPAPAPATIVVPSTDAAPAPRDTIVDDGVKDTGDFEVVEKETVPAPDAAEVQEAIKAQGEDGALLVNFVQVSKAEVPPADSHEVQEAARKATPPVVKEIPVASDGPVANGQNGEKHADCAPETNSNPPAVNGSLGTCSPVSLTTQS